jgi:hypothetical protein
VCVFLTTGSTSKGGGNATFSPPRQFALRTAQVGLLLMRVVCVGGSTFSRLSLSRVAKSLVECAGESLLRLLSMTRRAEFG